MFGRACYSFGYSILHSRHASIRNFHQSRAGLASILQRQKFQQKLTTNKLSDEAYDLFSKSLKRAKKARSSIEEGGNKPLTFDEEIDKIFEVLNQNLITSRHAELKTVTGVDEDFARLSEKYQARVKNQTDRPDTEWTGYEDFKEYCATQPVTPSWEYLKLGRSLMSNPHRFYKDAIRLLVRGFVQYVRLPDRPASKLDLTSPADWYPEARAIPRKVYLHVGPTNSGKTYTALQAFQNSQSGFYAGPLRLLAKEVYNRMVTAGKPCNLITGEEVIEKIDSATGEPATLSSGTVEMMEMNRDMDVAVIDEIQMIEDRDRGWAWTNAFLSVRAKEVHLCGDNSSVPVVKQLVQETGDQLEVITYNRLSPLSVASKELQGGLRSGISPGDCIVAFSKKELFQIKKQVEQELSRKDIKCALIYGSLPSETRSEQAKLFNDPNSKYKVLIASDAVGMGLNLAIKRVVFTTVRKFDGVQETKVSPAQIKQIGGRAGRYRVAGSASTVKDESLGTVTALNNKDLAYIKACFAKNTPTITKAGIFPSDAVLRQYALSIGYNTPFHEILSMVSAYSITSDTYELSDIRQMTDTARVFDGINRLTFEDKLVLSKAPANMSNPLVRRAFIRFCQVIANGESKNIVEVADTGIQYLRMSNLPMGTASETYESVHRVINLFLWLSYRFPNALKDRRGAFELRELCESKISTVLKATDATVRASRS